MKCEVFSSNRFVGYLSVTLPLESRDLQHTYSYVHTDPMGCQTYADEIVSGRTGTTTDSFGEGMGAVDSSRAAMNVGPQGEGPKGQHCDVAAGQKKTTS